MKLEEYEITIVGLPGRWSGEVRARERDEVVPEEPKCPECGSGVGRPKCAFEMGADCPRHAGRIEWENAKRYGGQLHERLVIRFEDQSRLDTLGIGLRREVEQDIKRQGYKR